MKVEKNVATFNVDSNNYEDSRPIYPTELFKLISKECNLSGKAWDCACGTGQVSKSLIEYFKEVYATDINENQIKNSFSDPSIKYSIQKSEETTFNNSTFDLVCVAQAMHWFNINQYFREVKRVLKPGGIFACFGYSFFKISPDIDQVIKRTILDPIRPYWSEKNEMLWNHYSEVSFPFEKIITPEIEMNRDWSKLQLLEYIKTWSAFKRFQEDTNFDIDKIFLNEIQSLWPSNTMKTVKMDFTLYLGRK